MLKKIFVIVGITAIFLAATYYFYIRKRYIDVLHTKINLENFTASDEGIEDMIDWYAETYHVPAISAALIKDGKVSRFIARGKRDKKKNAQVDENTIYQIASLSKSLTGIICNDLAMQGLLDLDKPIVNTFADELSEASKEKLIDIKLKNVLFHNSGLGRSMPGITKEDIFSSLETTALEFKPESKWQYSNFGYALISSILEKETGKTYQELLSSYVKEKYNLEICDAGLGNIDIERLAIAYWKHFKVLENPVFDFQMQNAASGIFTSAKSLSTLMIEQIKQYQKIDSTGTNSPLILNKQKVLSYGDDGFYGYGIFEKNFHIKYDTTITNNYLCHGGDADGYVSNYGFFPEYGIGVVVLSSSGGPWFWDMERNINAKLIESYLRNN